LLISFVLLSDRLGRLGSGLRVQVATARLDSAELVVKLVDERSGWPAGEVSAIPDTLIEAARRAFGYHVLPTP
jgi:hypothetical protein